MSTEQGGAHRDATRDRRRAAHHPLRSWPSRAAGRRWPSARLRARASRRRTTSSPRHRARAGRLRRDDRLRPARDHAHPRGQGARAAGEPGAQRRRRAGDAALARGRARGDDDPPEHDGAWASASGSRRPSTLLAWRQRRHRAVGAVAGLAGASGDLAAVRAPRTGADGARASWRRRTAGASRAGLPCRPPARRPSPCRRRGPQLLNGTQFMAAIGCMLVAAARRRSTPPTSSAR